jgi:hypothetical protein
LSQSVGGCGGILKTEPPVVEMTNELSSAPGEADALTLAQLLVERQPKYASLLWGDQNTWVALKTAARFPPASR